MSDKYDDAISDSDMIRLSADRLIQIWKQPDFPWLSMLTPTESSHDMRHEWKSSDGDVQYSNDIENIFVRTGISRNVIRAKALDDQSVEAILAKDVVSDFKWKLTTSTLFGLHYECREGCRGKMDGLYSIIPNDNKDQSGEWSMDNFQAFIERLKKRGAFPDMTGILLVNDAGAKRLTPEIKIADIRFTVIEEPTISKITKNDNTVMAFALTPITEGQKQFRLASPHEAIKDYGPLNPFYDKYYKIIKYCTLELRDPELHGFYVGKNK